MPETMRERSQGFRPWVWLALAVAITAQKRCTASEARPEWFYEVSPPRHGVFTLLAGSLAGTVNLIPIVSNPYFTHKRGF